MEVFEDNHGILKNEEGNFEVIDIHNISSLLTFDEAVDEINVFDMTSLGPLMLLSHASTKTNDLGNVDYTQDDTTLHRLSLAYERLSGIPKILLQELASSVKILDISHNEFSNLDFLTEFKNLTTLVCDHNNITSNTEIPYCPKLEFLWLNHCNISSLFPWAKKLQLSCPNLKYLSLMGNPIAPSYLNGGNFYEYLQYRLFIISLFPNLIHLDDRPVAEDQRKEAHRMYHIPLVERFMMKTQTALPAYLRTISTAVSDILTATPAFAAPEKNLVV